MIDQIFIFGAKYAFIIVALLALAVFLKQSKEGRKKMAIFAVIVLPIAYAVGLIASHLYFDPRPFVVGGFAPLIPHAADNGFPSDHALLVSALAAVAFPFASRRMNAALWIFAAYVAFSRVYVGVHHPIDVIGSAVISVAVALVAYKAS